MKETRFGHLLLLGLPIAAILGIALMPAGEGPAAGEAPPCLVVARDGGSRPGAKGRLVLAVWDDGTLLFAAGPAAPGERLLVGRAEKADVAAMLEAIAAAGFFASKREGYIVPDSSSTTIIARRGRDRAARSWHEYLLPGFEGDMDTDGDYRKFVRMWKGARGTIEGLAPVEVKGLLDLSGGKFRGSMRRSRGRRPG